MHVATLLKAKMFKVGIAGADATIEDIFPGWTTLDRFGLVIDEPLGGIGATHLIQIAMMAYYDIRPSRRSTASVYPEIYAFHIGTSHAAHAAFDFWPARREVVLRGGDHRDVLDAINDRGITRLAVPDRPMRDVVHRPKEVDAALDRIVSAFAYMPGGQTTDGDVIIQGLDRRTEFNPRYVLSPPPRPPKLRQSADSARPVKEEDEAYFDHLRRMEAGIDPADRRRAKEQRESQKSPDGLVSESYRRIGVAEALKRLASAGLA